MILALNNPPENLAKKKKLPAMKATIIKHFVSANYWTKLLILKLCRLHTNIQFHLQKIQQEISRLTHLLRNILSIDIPSINHSTVIICLSKYS